ncbi:hypothetical protein QTP70_000287 [Hemibagrus guttatus]|uniref:Tc1-like transposase DDE domain-containing protein n=1 Tax=Hemibagrus guttatus TaxID=175788 RepID=A0AAE0QAP3_9TELE|nr:hypothetical protein QTP70_000287 [Hemibagrus guttatus]
MVAELGGYKQAHPSPTPLTMGHSGIEEGPTSLKELGSRAQAVRGGNVHARLSLAGTAQPPSPAQAPSPPVRWWVYGKVGLHLSFGLCPAESNRQRLGHQALTCVPQPKAWLQGGAQKVIRIVDDPMLPSHKLFLPSGKGHRSIQTLTTRLCNLVKVDGIMKKEDYLKILVENLVVSAHKLNLPENWTYQQDNEPKHTARVVKQWFRDKQWLEWPSQSPDLNPIENLWRKLKIRVRARKPSNLQQLGTFVKEEWGNILQQTCRNLVETYKKHLQAIIKNKVFSTDY